MTYKKYSIGVDFGTQSGRAVLVEIETGNIIAVSVKNYTHGVMDEYLPDGITCLKPDWALQHPADYIEVLNVTIPEILKKSGVDPKNIIGMSVDFTACTMLPIDEDFIPICFKPEYKSNPHAYVKLWKHHSAQNEANKLNEIAEALGEKFLTRYGGKISSEWMFPKIMQVLNEAPDLFNKIYKFIEAADWISLILTGKDRRNSCTAGYKAMWNKREGYPSSEFFRSLDPRLENVIDDKLSREVYSIGGKAGELTVEMADSLGLIPGTAVGISNIDAHVAVPAVGITKPAKMLMIMGTSTCHMVLGNDEKTVPGICGVVEDGIIPGLFGYEAGQPCCGDHFEWFIKNCVPEAYFDQAKREGINIHELLRQKAKELKVGESGLLALDWWNGNRSVLSNADLTGLLIGCTIKTKPEEIYRALIEATAFGTNMIIENFEQNGVPIDELFACGGIAEKDDFMMQIYADVTNREIKISASSQTVALGSAMFGAVAAGKQNGGYDDILEAAQAMAHLKEKYYIPIPENVKLYRMLYQEYKLLHDYFGKGGNEVMQRLKKIKKGVVA